jgi:hypothetical protein
MAIAGPREKCWQFETSTEDAGTKGPRDYRTSPVVVSTRVGASLNGTAGPLPPFGVSETMRQSPHWKKSTTLMSLSTGMRLAAPWQLGQVT